MGNLGPWGAQVGHLFNKSTAFYILQSAQYPANTRRPYFIPGQIFSATFQEWIRCYDTNPIVDWRHFIANPVRVTPTGPSTVHHIVAAHRSLCIQASNLLDCAKEQDACIPGLRGADIRPYSLLPLYQALVVIFDSRWVPPKHQFFEPDGLVSLHKFAQNQTVLIARTGVEASLSAPITFAGLEVQSLPEGKGLADEPDSDVIRVSLATAVRFIFDLEQRGNLAHPKIHDATQHDPYLDPRPPEGFADNHQIRHDPETWANANLEAAQKHGLENVQEVWESVHRVHASLIGEEPGKLEHLPYEQR
ncbi:MAG: hypothetical protein LQ350_007550 [Teloschistes chrysophthalmus]|nr:MAG: hypothetical protein LQ350_007550 [Niorma chrysophthalma]